MVKKLLFLVFCLCQYCAAAVGAEFTGVVKTLHVNLEVNKAYVSFEGTPTINEGSCSNIYAVNFMSNAEFTSYIWPVLMTAKVAGDPIKIYINGCTGTQPLIQGVWYSPD